MQGPTTGNRTVAEVWKPNWFARGKPTLIAFAAALESYFDDALKEGVRIPVDTRNNVKAAAAELLNAKDSYAAAQALHNLGNKLRTIGVGEGRMCKAADDLYVAFRAPEMAKRLAYLATAQSHIDVVREDMRQNDVERQQFTKQGKPALMVFSAFLSHMDKSSDDVKTQQRLSELLTALDNAKNFTRASYTLEQIGDLLPAGSPFRTAANQLCDALSAQEPATRSECLKAATQYIDNEKLACFEWRR